MGVKCYGGFCKTTGLLFQKSRPSMPTAAHRLAGSPRLVPIVGLSCLARTRTHRVLRPQYTSVGLQATEIKACLNLAGQAVVCANWLSATARRELAHFREFITWLRYGEWPQNIFSSVALSVRPFGQKHQDWQTLIVILTHPLRNMIYWKSMNTCHPAWWPARLTNGSSAACRPSHLSTLVCQRLRI